MHENEKFRKKCVKIFYFYFLFFKNFKNAECDALLQGFVNEIQSSILFYLWNYRRRDFLKDPQTAYIFYANRFIYFLQKKSRNNV